MATLRNFMLLVLFLAGTTSLTCQAQLSSTFYSQTCPNALTTIRNSIRSSISAERRMAASLIRLHFHDCFVQGCDASILLDDISSITGEQNAAPNKDSARGYNVIRDGSSVEQGSPRSGILHPSLNVIAKAKTAVEKVCPGVVSCADILSVAARDASVMVGGPSWTVNLGRKDSKTASKSLAEQELPSFKEPLARLISIFDKKGLSERDLVALSGAHTIGQASCRTFQDRIYSNGSDIDAGFASTRRRRCPNTKGDGTLAPLDLVTPDSFDYNYFKNLMQKKGLLESDQILFSGSTQSIVSEFSSKPANFNRDFASAMIKMGNIIDSASSSNGEIRRICSAVN